MTDQPRRRWFRFGLRTLFVIVTVLCCYLAWETTVVRQRRIVLKELRADGRYQVITAEEWSQRVFLSPGERPASVSLTRWWLGDQAVQQIVYAPHLNPSSVELVRISQVFPEATLHEQQLLYEPCHPGCFPAGTMVETLSGPRRIETICEGDFITTVAADGDATAAQVQTIFITDNRLWRVDTDAGTLITTETQPLYVGAGKNVQVGDLHAGDTVYRWQDGIARPVEVRAVSTSRRLAKVYNLILGNSEVFVAGGFLARSKPPANSDSTRSATKDRSL